MNINKILLALALSMLLTSCTNKGTSVPVENTVPGQDYHVRKLFTTDGCTVYRFYDAGNFHYMTNCTSTITTITESCGKNCTEDKGYENYTSHPNENTGN